MFWRHLTYTFEVFVFFSSDEVAHAATYTWFGRVPKGITTVRRSDKVAGARRGENRRAQMKWAEQMMPCAGRGERVGKKGRL